MTLVIILIVVAVVVVASGVLVVGTRSRRRAEIAPGGATRPRAPEPSTAPPVTPAAEPEAAAVPEAPELVVALDGAAEPDVGPEDLLPLEQPVTPAIAVAVAIAINSSRFNRHLLCSRPTR